ncbi:MAG: copper ion binding protein, partial [Burkholderiaceae bacterium]
MDAATRISSNASDLSFRIEGMSCASCVTRVEKALKAVPGVESVSVNLATERASVHASAVADAQTISAAVEKAGYEVPVASTSLNISGMTCASCVQRVEKALKKIPGVLNASVNLATERAQVTSLGVAPERLLAAVEKAGYGAALASEDAPTQSTKPALPAWWPVALSALLTLPLVIPMLLMPFGRAVTVPGWLQMVLATPVQFWLGARFYK